MKTQGWMKNNEMKKAILVATMSMLTMVGCANNNSNNGAAIRSNSRNTSNLPTNQLGAAVASLVYNTTVTGSSASVSGGGLIQQSVPGGTQVGSIDNNSGMSITGQVHFDGAYPTSNMIPTQSYIEIQIRDSFAVQSPSQYGPFNIAIGNNSTSYGSLSNTGQGTDAIQMVFQDSYGWVMISGSLSTANFTGRVYWGEGQYTTAPTWNYLGDFTTQGCGSFFTCQ